MKPGTVTAKDSSVLLYDAVPELLEGLAGAARVFGRAGLPVIVTSLNDGRHRNGSFHYSGRAADLRSKHVARDQKGPMLEALRAELGERFDVLLEDVGGANEHFHLEFDP